MLRPVEKKFFRILLATISPAAVLVNLLGVGETAFCEGDDTKSIMSWPRHLESMRLCSQLALSCHRLQYRLVTSDSHTHAVVHRQVRPTICLKHS